MSAPLPLEWSCVKVLPAPPWFEPEPAPCAETGVVVSFTSERGRFGLRCARCRCHLAAHLACAPAGGLGSVPACSTCRPVVDALLTTSEDA
jgi:hypothetical protein